MKLLRRACVALVPLAVTGGLLAMPSSAGAQVDLYPVCQLVGPAPGPQNGPIVVLLTQELAASGCGIVAGEVYTVTSVLESQLGSG